MLEPKRLEPSEVSGPAQAATPAALRRGAPVARSAARATTDERDARIIKPFNDGISVAEIAVMESVSLKRMRNRLREILAKREPRPPAEFLARQAKRLNETLHVFFDAMSDPQTGANFEAIDRVVAIVRALDRVSGSSASIVRSGAKPRRAPPSQAHLAPARVPQCLAKKVASD